MVLNYILAVIIKPGSIEDLKKRTSVSGTTIDYMKINNMLGDMPESNQLSLF